MKKLVLIASTMLAGVLLGSIITGSVFAADPTPQTTPTPTVPGNGYYGRGMMGGGATGGGMMGRGAGSMMGGDYGMEQAVLTLLNMTQQQMISERQAGKSLVQIAATKNVNEQTLVDTILTAKRADLDALVSQGRLTQAQADQMYANMQQAVPQAVSRTTTGPMWGNGTMPMDPNDCPMLNGTNNSSGQPNNVQPGTRQMPGRGGMMNGGGMRGFNGPTT